MAWVSAGVSGAGRVYSESPCLWSKCVTAAGLLQALNWTSWRVETSGVGKTGWDLDRGAK